MKNWEKKKLGDICGFVRGPFGGSLKKNIFKPEGYAVYEQQHAIYDQFDDIRYFIDENKFNEMKRFELNSGDLIMSCSGTMGKIAIVPENIKKGIINQALLKLTPSKKISTVFLKLWMQSESFQESLKEYSGGAAIQNVASVAILKQIEIPLPPLPEQQRIVSILDEAFAAIAKAKANAEQNLKNAKELFESYLQGVFEKKGDGWEEKKLGEVCDIKHGYAFEGDDFETDFSGSNPIVLTPGNFTEDSKLSFTTKNTKRCKTEYPKDYLFSVGELVVVMTDLSSLMKILGKPAIIDRDDILHNQRIGRFVFKEDSIEKSYLFYFLQTNKYLNKVKESATGTMVRHTAPKRILNIEIQFPKSHKEQQTIVRQLDALRAETQKLEAVYQKKIADLEELKKSILQKAFAGELRSPEGAAYDSEAATPLAKKTPSSITSPEGASRL